MRPEGYPKTPELDRMKQQKHALGLGAVADFLEQAAECRLPLELLVNNEPLVKRFTEKAVRAHVVAFLVWIEHQLETAKDDWDQGAILFPSERLFAAYAEIDLQKVSAEKDAVVAWMRGERPPQTTATPLTDDRPLTLAPSAKGVN
jgi:hypothetical protein